jgi:hypothetical protein
VLKMFLVEALNNKKNFVTAFTLFGLVLLTSSFPTKATKEASKSVKCDL